MWITAEELAHDGDKPYTVDPRLPTIALAAGKGDLVLPRQVVEIAACVDELGRLARVEQIKKFTIVAGDWLPGGDELTPTMKLKRKPIAEKYAAQIEAMYGG